MPTSKNLLGNSSAKLQSPVPSAIAAVTQQIRASFLAKLHIVSPKQAEKFFPELFGSPVFISNLPIP